MTHPESYLHFHSWCHNILWHSHIRSHPGLFRICPHSDKGWTCKECLVASWRGFLCSCCCSCSFQCSSLSKATLNRPSENKRSSNFVLSITRKCMNKISLCYRTTRICMYFTAVHNENPVKPLCRWNRTLTLTMVGRKMTKSIIFWSKILETPHIIENAPFANFHCDRMETDKMDNINNDGLINN